MAEVEGAVVQVVALEVVVAAAAAVKQVVYHKSQIER
jgi:hypothetical protein